MIKRFTFEIDTDDEQKNWTEYFRSVINSCYESEKADSFVLMNLKEDNTVAAARRPRDLFNHDNIVYIATFPIPAGTLENFATDFADKYRSRVYKFYSGPLRKDIYLKYDNGKLIRVCITSIPHFHNETRGKHLRYLTFDEVRNIDFDDLDAVNKLLHEINGNEEN